MFFNSKDLKITKVLNNNVVMILDGEIERILIGRGIGFGLNSGGFLLDKSKIEKVFTIEQQEYNTKFNKLVQNVSNDIIGICEEIIYMISKELGEVLSERIHIGLTDHIQFMIYRLNNNNEISNPFILEIMSLYKEEFRIAEKAVKMLKDYTKLDIPDEEIGFIAIHINSARSKNDLTQTLKFTFLCNSITELLEDELNIEIDRETLDYARFLTHLRFAIQRTVNGKSIKNELLDVTKKKMKKFFKISKKVAGLIEEDLGIKVEEDEIAYITFHVSRLSLL
jgi:transcriptional antiterminator